MLKRVIIAMLGASLLLLCTSCSQAPPVVDDNSTVPSQNDTTIRSNSSSAPSQDASIPDAPTADPHDTTPLPTTAAVRLIFGENEAIISLVDNTTTRDFVAKLPLTQTFEDFNSIEKICRLPDALSVGGVEQGVDPNVADITLYVPWNTLVFYYDDYGYHKDLIPIGRVESGMDLLEAQTEDFTVTMELITSFDGGTLTAENTNSTTSSTDITMTVGEMVIAATLNDSETSKAFLATLPRTIAMTEYGEREFYGRMEAISENVTSIPDFENGDVTYYTRGPSFAVFYANSDKSDLDGLIRMGKITSDLGNSIRAKLSSACCGTSISSLLTLAYHVATLNFYCQIL